MKDRYTREFDDAFSKFAGFECQAAWDEMVREWAREARMGISWRLTDDDVRRFEQQRKDAE